MPVSARQHVISLERPSLGADKHVPAVQAASGAEDGPAAFVAGSTRPHDTDRPDIETASADYAERFAGEVGAWFIQQQARVVAALLDRIERPDPLDVLDVGGGHCHLVPVMIERGHRVVVQGSAPSTLERVRMLECVSTGRVEGCISPLWELPFPDRTFDLVASVRLLGHVTRWRELVREITRVSNDYVMLEFARAGAFLPHLQAVTDSLFSLKRRFEGTTRPFFSYRRAALVTELRRNGFSVVAEEAQFALPMVLHRIGGNATVSSSVEEGLKYLGVGRWLRSPVIILARRDPALPRER